MNKNLYCDSIRNNTRHMLTSLFSAGITSVKGDTAVAEAFAGGRIAQPTKILAVGKAAYAMYRGVPQEMGNFTPALVVTKDGHAESAPNCPNLEIVESSHPLPCIRSLLAGLKVRHWVDSCQRSDRLLMLISGGASSLIEVLQPNLNLEDLIASTNFELSIGSDIGGINQRRIEKSLIKGGKLLAGFRGESVDVLAISDVPRDDIMVIGSGIGAYLGQDFIYKSEIVGSNAVARNAVLHAARGVADLHIRHNSETLYGDIGHVSRQILSAMDAGEDGLYIFGGEPTVKLPKNPGHGGRNQGLALLLAQLIVSKPGYSFVVGGTDGSDGVSNAAGAFVDCKSFQLADSGLDAILKADSGRFFGLTGDQIVTGPTGTNVMDLVIGLKIPQTG